MTAGPASAVGLLLLVLLAAAAVFSQRQADAARDAMAARPDAPNDLLYLPNERLLNYFTGGMDSVIADLLWIKCVQYTAAEAKGARDFQWLQHMLDTVTRLDPHFVDAYRFGGIFLAALKADSDAGLELLERGMKLNPGAWELPYEAGMIFLLNRRNDADAQKQAAMYLGKAAATGKAPKLVLDVAEKLQGKHDLVEVEAEMWNGLLHSDDQLLRDMAARKLQELKLRETVRVLNERAVAYARASGRKAESLEDLVKGGLIKSIPQDPLGGQFVLDAQGVVQSTTLLEEVKTRYGNLIRDALKKYHEVYGAWPPSLQDLVKNGLMTEIPPHPYAGDDWGYNSTTGAIR